MWIFLFPLLSSAQIYPATLPSECASYQGPCVDAPPLTFTNATCVEYLEYKQEEYSLLCASSISSLQEIADCSLYFPCFTCSRLVECPNDACDSQFYELSSANRTEERCDQMDFAGQPCCYSPELQYMPLECHVCQDFEIEKRIEDSSKFACNLNCVTPIWDHFVGGMGMALIVWFLVVGLTILLFILKKRTMAPGTRMEVFAIWLQGVLHSSPLFYLLIVLSSVGMVAIYVVRVNLEKATDRQLGWELLCSVVILIDALVGSLASLCLSVETALYNWVFSLPLDSFILSSPLSIAAVSAGVPAKKSWFSLGFFALLRLPRVYRIWFDKSTAGTKNDVLTETVGLVISTLSFWVFAGLSLHAADLFGDVTLYRSTPEEIWTPGAAAYFLVVSISTVGYGDVQAVTLYGRLLVTGALVLGIVTISVATQHLLECGRQDRHGRGSYHPPARETAGLPIASAAALRTKHMVLTGNPSGQGLVDFVTELFHPDHYDPQAEIIDLVVLMPLGSAAGAALKTWLGRKRNISISRRVTLLNGSVLHPEDLERTKAREAFAFVVLPQLHAENPSKEDAENVIRVLSIRRVAWGSRIICILLQSANYRLLASSVGENEKLDIICMDKFKMELMGKSCQIPGFCSLISNLCRSFGEEEGGGRGAQGPAVAGGV